MKENLNIEEVAEYLGVSKRTVNREISEGNLTAFLVRGSLRVPKKSLDEYCTRRILEYRKVIENLL